MMLGAGRSGSIQLVGANSFALNAYPALAKAGFVFEPDGEIIRFSQSILGLTTVSIDPWYTTAPRSGIGDGYQIKAHKTAGTGALEPDSDDLDTWLSLSSTRAWYIASNFGHTSATLTIEIRAAGGSTVLATGTYQLRAESSN